MNSMTCKCPQPTTRAPMMAINRQAWHTATDWLTGAASRLHRYRDLRARLFRDALDRRDLGE